MESLGVERRITYDARGLVEPDATPPLVAEVDGTKAEFDAHDLTTRQINLELRRLLYEEGVTDVTVRNPGAKHSLGVCKDEMAAKPLVLYESDDLVALASEEIAIRAVVDREIETYDPYEREVLVWNR